MTSRGRAWRWWRWLIPVGLGVGIGLGPRAAVEPTGAPDRAPDRGPDRGPDRARGHASPPAAFTEWPAWLAEQEQRAGVTDTGKMARVVFATPSSPARTPWSVVYLHGFSATRQETAPVAERIADSLHANLFEARLQGHGLPSDSMGTASARQWIRDAEDALAAGAALGDSVLLIGTSTGGTLAAWLGAQPEPTRRALRAVVLISPNFGVNGAASAVLSWPWASVVLPRLIPTYSWTPRNEAHGRYWTTSYPSRALFPMTALVDAVNDRPLRDWTTATLMLYNPADPVVDAAAATAWLDRLRGSTTARVESQPITPIPGEDGHVIAGRITAPSQVAPFVERIVRFVRVEPAR